MYAGMIPTRDFPSNYSERDQHSRLKRDGGFPAVLYVGYATGWYEHSPLTRLSMVQETHIGKVNNQGGEELES